MPQDRQTHESDMFAFTRLIPGQINLQPGQVLLRSQDYQQRIAVDELLVQAQEQTQALAIEAREAYEQQSRLGWQVGMEEASAERAELIHQTLLQCQSFCRQFEERVAQVVLQSVRKLIADYPMGERIAKATQDGLALLGEGARVALHVHPQEVAAVRDGLERLEGGTGHIDVVANPLAQLGDCVLESEIGSVDVSIETQLKALQAALTKEVCSTSVLSRK
ncbi:HrpE/YscL family type III secretion apparatus protein [Pseudomonas entomophila]|uniref:HrpE/YscL family type III secretion apparatus protein n=1 Tax=Pseudomonas entomophila TaxID=312306 RepID=UPI002405B000|nr:HrpE/YscL family type III secretion apparatus protein [Pseudomonas entomophila]MDF9618769.1 HrpE/YscL family type III secretion apparatus protein [Pseudomonas entomophila]